METLDSLKKQLSTSKGIKQVVTTMKALAGANIKRYEKATHAIYMYRKNIELGLRGVLSKDFSITHKYDNDKECEKYIIVAIGSNQGLCGRFNDKIIEFLVDDLKKQNLKKEDVLVYTVGDRLAMLVENKDIKPIFHLSVPNAIESIADSVYLLLSKLDNIKDKYKKYKILLYHTKHESSSNGVAVKTQLLPINPEIFESIKEKSWPTKELPFWRIDGGELLKDLIKQYLFTTLYYTFSTSITSEQMNRLMTLQNAENNINDMIENTKLKYNQQRQMQITSQLLDVVSGAQVAKNKKKKKS